MNKKILLLINVSSIAALVILGLSLIAPVLPQCALSFDVPLYMTGWAVSSFGVARMVMGLPAGILADRFGRKRNMVVGLIMVLISSLVSGLAPTYGLLVLGRIFQGFGSALYSTAAVAWIAEISAGEYRGRFMAFHTTLVHIGASTGPIIGGFSAHYFGLNGPFFIYGGLAIIGLIATLPLHEVTSSSKMHSTISLADVKNLLNNRSFLLVNSAVLTAFFFRAGVQATLVPLYASLNLHLMEAQIGVVMTVAAVMTALVTYPSGWFSDKVGRKIPAMSSLILSAVAVLLLPLQKDMFGLAIALGFLGLTTGLQGSLGAWPADVVPKNSLGTAIGMYRVIGDIGFVLGPLLVTYTAGAAAENEGVPFTPFVIPAIIAIVAAILVIWAADPAAKRKAQGTIAE